MVNEQLEEKKESPFFYVIDQGNGLRKFLDLDSVKEYMENNGFRNMKLYKIKRDENIEIVVSFKERI